MNPAPPTPFQKWQLIVLATFTLLLSGGLALWFLQPGAADNDAPGKAAAANQSKDRPASAPAPAAMPQPAPPAAPQAEPAAAAAGADGQPRPSPPPAFKEPPALNATTAVAQAPAQPPQTPAPAEEPAETPASLLAQPLDLADPAKREEVVRRLREMEDKRKEAAWELARQKGIAIRGKRPNGKEFELQYFENGEPVYHVTNNVNAAISTGAHQVRGTSPFNVTGAGVTTGIWDSGIPRLTHQEFGSRITVMDGHATVSEHANHVTGTIAAAGVEPSIKGMAPEVLVNSYYFGNDVSEMTNAGAALPGQAGKLYLSNHSYGGFLGWDYQGGSLPDDWYGTFSNNSNPADDLEDDFGRYASTSVAYDGLCSNLPYYLPFFAAGNERTDTPPPAGFPWYHISTGNTYSYNASQHPAGDDSYKGGYDNIGGDAVSKNVMTVGAVNDAVVSSSRNLPAATITTFSSYGPADDGRIKPDIVANGQSLTSTGISSNSATSTKSGTSMATPNATGSAALLVDYYGTRFPGQAMRAATLKGLIIHTADDIGNPGPDYRFGWGLMNTKAAADLLKNHADKAGNGRLVESSLSTTVTSRTHSFVWNGTTPLRVTLCWTDPAGTSKTGHDNRTKALVNDLNLSIAPPPGGGSTLRPYVMPHVGDWTNATLNSNAVTGVNTVDNVEQIYLPAPLTFGVYTVTVNHTGTLANGEQPYSLIVSGEAFEPLTVTPDTPFLTSGPQGGPFPSGTYTLTNTGGSPVNWYAVAATFLEFSPQIGTLAAGASTTVTVTPSALANTLGAGIYSTPVLFTNSGTTVSQSVSATLTVVSAATLPFTENFESPTLDSFWTVSGTGPFRTALSTANSPHGGTRHVVMDSSSSSSYARNELTLAANLAGRGSVMLSFWAREFGDEVNTPPAGSFANGANFDGVAISADGITWHPVLAMPAVFESHTQFSVNLDEAVSAAGLTYGQIFRIRFNQYDDNAVPTDGIAWDDISLTSGASTPWPGTLGFSAATYSINEDQGTATITVTRAGGSHGAASVSYATSNGSATAGSDYTTTSGTLSWTANQPGTKSFTIPIINDTTAEPAETINLTLSSAEGAVLFGQTTATLSIANDDSTPEIVVEQPAGLGLADGSGSISFGARAMGVSTAAKTVVVRNTGSADLTGLSVTKDGGQAADFLVGTLGSTTLAPGASTTFTVQFTPSALGARNAAIHIASSDLDENPFDITLSGTGASQADSLIFEIASLDSTGSAVTDHSSLTGDDRGGIAVSSSRVFVAGDSNTSSHALGNLSGGVSLGAVRDGLCSDLQTGTVYNLAHNGAGFVAGGTTVSQLIEMDPVSGALTANVITLSAPVPVASSSGVFSGSGRVVIHNGTHVYDIRLPSGTVTNLGEMARPAWQAAENWAMWGVAEFFTGKLFLTYRATGTQSIVRTRVPDGQTQTVATFTGLGEMANWTASPANNRWYFHVEGSTQFGGSGETLGYANATYNQGPPTAPPVITSPLTAGGLAGQAFSYQITASGSATNFGASGLPPGLSVNVETGLISGSAAAGIYPITISASNAVETTTASMTLTLQTPAPEIAIADGATQLTDNVSNLTFTNVNLGSSSTARTITISNPGTGPLTGFPITVSGANPGDFVVSTPGSSSLAPAGTTTFTITFTPTQAGARAATIQVASNDADENPFDFTVQGTAVAQPPSITSTTASKVELDTATLNCLVNPRGGTTSVTFDWGLTTSYGSTTTAQNVGNGVTPVNASVRLTGLLPNTTYNFRATATSSDGSTTSSNVSFTTGIAYYVNDGSTTNDAWCTAVGNDSNNGLTPATPKATVQAIISTYVLEPGDVVRIDTGSYSLATDIVVSS
ncbi:MAG: S8 family serine peptidase, partial [Prosthecobacter sp.]